MDITTTGFINDKILTIATNFAVSLKDYTDSYYTEYNRRRKTNIAEIRDSKIAEMFAHKIFKTSTPPDFNIHSTRAHDPDIKINDLNIHIKLCRNKSVKESYSFNNGDPIIKEKKFTDKDILAGFIINDNIIELRVFKQIKDLEFKDPQIEMFKGMFYCAYYEDIKNPLSCLDMI